MARPANLYQQVPSIAVPGAGESIFKDYPEAARFLLTGLGNGERGTNIDAETAQFIVDNRELVIRVLTFPSPRKPRTPKTKPEGK